MQEAGFARYPQLEPNSKSIMKTKLTLFVAVFAVALFGMGCASVKITKEQLQNGLVAYYPFDENAKDESGNNYHGFLEGPTSTTNRFGQPNQAIAFDGPKDGVSLPNQVFNGLEAFTFTMWLNLDAPNKSQTILSLANTNDDNAVMIHFKNGSLHIYVTHQEERRSLSVSEDIFEHNWRQIAVAREFSSATIKVYVDGVQKSNLAFTKTGALAVDPGGAWLGQDQDSVGGGFETYQALKGSLDDVRIYNRALSAEEVKALYDLEKPKGK
jgi:hypothetical protein